VEGDAYIEEKVLNNDVEDMPSVSLTLRGSGVLNISKENNNG
jgi:hypothetical protein